MEASYNEVQEDKYPVHFYAAPETDHTASDFVSTRTALPDLLTDSVIHITDCVDQDDTSVDLIDLSDPPPQPALPPALVLPVKVGYIYAKKREFEIPVHFYTALESEKLEMVTQFLLNGPYAEQGDTNNNRSTKVTLVASSSSELIAAMLRIDAVGVDCFSGDDHSIRDGHCSRSSERMTVNVAKAPVCSKIKHS
ncbi:hypothetical protein AAVH_09580 [Aphelenchoides avenae]|nr:hypothetical protein AAVH_09580 [Aphelenchus avenae]